MQNHSYYEKYRDDMSVLSVARNGDHTFPAHFHLNTEIFLLKKGEYRLTVNGESYLLSEGSVVVMDGFAVHAYERLKEEADDCVLFIPYHYEKRFERRKGGRLIANPVITDAALCEELLALTDTYLSGDPSEETKHAACELILSRLGDVLVFKEGEEKGERLLVRKILLYIEENYRTPLTRKSIAHALGYTKAHVSRVFHRFTRQSISEYVNRLRYHYVQRRRAAGDTRSILELIGEAGFGSQQTYYRFLKNVAL